MVGWKVPRIWEGGTCFIIGGGPSMLSQFDIPEDLIQKVYHKQADPSVYSSYMEKIHNEHVIAVNMAFRIGPWIDIAYFGDPGFWKTNRDELLKFKGLRVTCADAIEPIYGAKLKYLRKNPKRRNGITNDPSFVSWNHNSGGSAINLAVHLGVKRIILLGFDMKVDAHHNQHWHKYYYTNPKTVNGTMAMHKKGFPQIAEDAKKLGVEILNASPDSALDCFTKINLKDIL
jgi:hypothetical protein